MAMRILMFRCCRLPQFQAALARVRENHPSAEVWALAQERFRDELLTSGVDHVVAHEATRFTVFRLGLKVIRRVRALDADLVVLPLMDAHLPGAANLLRLAALVGARHAVIYPGAGAPLHADRRALRDFAWSATLRCPEGVQILWQMLNAWWRPLERRPRPAPGARRRVLHIINSLGVGGAQTQLAELVAATPADAYCVDILLLSDDGQPHGGLRTRPDVTIRVLDRSARLGTPIDAIADVCRSGRYDIVHTWLPQANMYGAAAARLAGVPRIITSVRSLNPGRYPQWCRWWYRPADVVAARLADVVTVNASALARDHSRWALLPRRRIAVVHNGLDVSAEVAGAGGAARQWLREVLSVSDAVPVVGVVGRLATEKDQSTFVRALGVLRRQGIAVHGVVVGDGPCAGDLAEIAAAEDLGAHISFLGARADSRRVIAGLDLLMLTSRIEGFPNVLLEATLLGVPVSSSDVGGVRDLIDEREALFPAAQPAAAAAAIRHALADHDRTMARTARLRQRSQQLFTRERMVARWLSLYEGGSYVAAQGTWGRVAPALPV